jgi:hypothetical protein
MHLSSLYIHFLYSRFPLILIFFAFIIVMTVIFFLCYLLLLLLWAFSASRHSYLKIGQDRVLPHPFQFIHNNPAIPFNTVQPGVVTTSTSCGTVRPCEIITHFKAEGKRMCPNRTTNVGKRRTNFTMISNDVNVATTTWPLHGDSNLTTQSTETHATLLTAVPAATNFPL